VPIWGGGGVLTAALEPTSSRAIRKVASSALMRSHGRDEASTSTMSSNR
jgi:hypothetical protein